MAWFELALALTFYKKQDKPALYKFELLIHTMFNGIKSTVKMSTKYYTTLKEYCILKNI